MTFKSDLKYDISGLHPDYFDSTSNANSSLEYTQCQVTCMTYHCEQVLLGTTGGCVISLDSRNLMPLHCLQPHGSVPYYVGGLLPLADTRKYLSVGRGHNHPLGTDGSGADKSDSNAMYLLSWYAKVNQCL